MVEFERRGCRVNSGRGRRGQQQPTFVLLLMQRWTVADGWAAIYASPSYSGCCCVVFAGVAAYPQSPIPYAVCHLEKNGNPFLQVRPFKRACSREQKHGGEAQQSIPSVEVHGCIGRSMHVCCCHCRLLLLLLSLHARLSNSTMFNKHPQTRLVAPKISSWYHHRQSKPVLLRRSTALRDP